LAQGWSGRTRRGDGRLRSVKAMGHSREATGARGSEHAVQVDGLAEDRHQIDPTETEHDRFPDAA
jgi:hypothetical protein